MISISKQNRSSGPYRAVFMLVVFLASVAAVSATAVPESDEPVRPVRIEYPQSVSSIPLLSLVEDFPDEYEGTFFTDHPQALARLINGEVDLLASGFTVGLTRHRAIGDIVHLATPIWGASALMVQPGVTSYADLAGGTLYAPFEGSPIDLAIREILAFEGLEDEIELRYAPFPQAAALLAEADTQAAVLVEPLASRLEIIGTAVRLENLHDAWQRATGEPRSPQVAVFLRRDNESMYEAAVLLRERLAQKIAEINDDPARFAARYAEALGFPVAVVEQAIANTLFDAVDEAATREIVDAYATRLGLPAPDASFYFGSQ